MQRGRDHPAVDPAVRQLAEVLQDQGLNLILIARLHALQAHAEKYLRQVGLQSAAGQILAEPGVNQGLAQRGTRGAEQRVFEHLQGTALVGVNRVLQQPSERDKALGFFGRVWINRIGKLLPLGRGKARLGPNGGINGVRLVGA